jgi:hypothetical protein
MADGLPTGEVLYPSLRIVNLSQLCGSARFKRMDNCEAYYRCTQYDGRRYDWNGAMRGYGQAADIAPGWYVPLKLRRPSSRYDLARLVVQRFTAMVFGTERFPEIIVEGDDDAQDYVRALSDAAKLPARMHEIRNKGGAQGSVGASFGFVDGKPRISVHNGKHVQVLSWADRYARRPSEVLEAYSYPRTVWDRDSGRPKEVTLYFARYWSEQLEVTWEPIPEEIARQPGGAWRNRPHKAIRHGYGFCPFYWFQNTPDSDDIDGDSDFEGQEDKIDEINTLLSATSKGTIANVDPTLIIKDDPQTANTGSVRKGSENAIYSKNGAEYLELKGESLKAGLALLAEHKQEFLDTVGCILGDPDKMSSSVQSAAALKILYMPMLNRSDIFRDQYGEGMVQLLTGMLTAAKMVYAQEEGPVVLTEDGHRMQDKPTVDLPPRMVQNEATGEMEPVERNPGDSDTITLNWPPYFPNTWQDTKQAVEATQAARGGSSAIISRKTAVENLAPLFGIADVDQEIESMDADRATDMAMMNAAMSESAGPGGGDEEDDEDEGEA